MGVGELGGIWRKPELELPIPGSSDTGDIWPVDPWPIDEMVRDRARSRARALREIGEHMNVAPSYRTGTNNGTNSGTTVALTVPGTVAVGDLLLVAFMASVAGRTVTPPAGWNPAPRLNGTAGLGGTAQFFAYYKIADAGDPSTAYTWTFSGAAAAYSGVMSAYQGVHESSPFNTAQVNTIAGGGTLNIGKGYSPIAGCLYVSLAGFKALQNETATAFTTGAAANWTRRDVRYQATGNENVIVADNTTNAATANTPTGAGATTWVVAGGSNNGAGVVYSLAPASQTSPWIVNNLGGGNGGVTTTNASISSANYSNGVDAALSIMPGLVLHIQVGINDKTKTFSAPALQTNGQAMSSAGCSLYDAATNLRQQAYWLYLTPAMTVAQGETGPKVTISGACNYTGVGVIVGGYASTVAVQDEQRADSVSNTTTPDPPQVNVSDLSTVVVYAQTATTGTFPAPVASTGYTFGIGWGNSSQSQLAAAIESKVLGTGQTTENPGTWSSFASNRWISTTTSLTQFAAPVNTVAPSIAGTPIETQTMTCTDGTWTGTPAPTITRKWQQSATGVGGWSDIGGATGTTYVLQAGDVGKYIRALVTGTNSVAAVDAPSNVVGPIAPACNAPVNTVAPAISGTVLSGHTITCSTGTWTGDPTITFTYQWQRDNTGGGVYSNIGGQTASSYTITPSDYGCHLRCVVTANNPCLTPVPANSAPTIIVIAPPVNTVPPAITGAPSVGHTLVSTTGTWTG